jgi:hypothetical protein
MSKVFEIATNISTPLMLAGFLAAVVFFIFRQILKNQEPLRNKSHNTIVILIINKLFILALIAMVLGFIGWIIKARKESQNQNHKSKMVLNVFYDKRPAHRVWVSGTNVRDNRSTDIYGSVELIFDKVLDSDSIDLFFKSVEFDIDTVLTVLYKSYHKFHFFKKEKPNIDSPINKPIKPPLPAIEKLPLKEIIKYTGEIDNRISQMEKYLNLVNSDSRTDQKSYFSNGIRAAFNGARGWYQPTHTEFHEVPLFTLIQWFKSNGLKNKYANQVSREILSSSTNLESNSIYDYPKTKEFINLLKKYRDQYEY